VQRGQRIAASGNVGRSMMPHLHFHVTTKDGDYLPTSFADVQGDRGIPRMFKMYTSGNNGPL
jgi:murein DD-endopeptidase MepM/ murein hydrolase activator NlpD